MLNFVPDTALLQTMFAQAAAPAFLLAGIAAFISILLSRLTAVINQIHALNEVPDSDSLRARRKVNIPQLKRRAALLHRATYFALLAGICTVLLLIVMASFTFIGLHHIFGGALLFAMATILFTMALFKFAQEIKIALHEINEL